MKYLVIAIILILGLGLLSCSNNTSAGVLNYTSTRYGIEVKLPFDWAAVEGPQMLSVKTIEGLVSFNSWGQTDFWAKAEEHNNPGGIGYTYSPEIIARQIPPGGAYIALVSISGPNPLHDKQPEYPRDDLQDLYQPHDWRLDSTTSAYFKNFYKADMSLTLTVACSPNASDETVTQINDLLKSWKFVNFTNGNN